MVAVQMAQFRSGIYELAISTDLNSTTQMLTNQAVTSLESRCLETLTDSQLEQWMTP